MDFRNSMNASRSRPTSADGPRSLKNQVSEPTGTMAPSRRSLPDSSPGSLGAYANSRPIHGESGTRPIA